MSVSLGHNSVSTQKFAEIMKDLQVDIKFFLRFVGTSGKPKHGGY